MKHIRRRLPLLFVPVVLFLLVGCAAQVQNRPEDVRIVTVSANTNVKPPPPVFLISEWQQQYNRVGAVRAEQQGGYERIVIDPNQAVFYFEKFQFTTQKGTYSNLVYRVHFPRIPFSLIPFHLAYGSNVGILVVITVDSYDKPVLVTTVNTCGCYVAVIPTNYLPSHAYPANWPERKQYIYGERLPSRLLMNDPEERFLIAIRPAVNRVMDVQVIAKNALLPYQEIIAGIKPLSELKSLPLANGGTTSMFYDGWPLQGHVKGAVKPWESLLLSLISLDLFVGMDKEYGSTTESGNPFYTSLKPWNHKASDMNDFAGFLEFNGWKL